MTCLFSLKTYITVGILQGIIHTYLFYTPTLLDKLATVLLSVAIFILMYVIFTYLDTIKLKKKLSKNNQERSW